MPTKDEIFEKIQHALVDALGVDEDEVISATLRAIWGEPIDFLDIVFRLEKAFDTKIGRAVSRTLTNPTYAGRPRAETGRRAAQADAVANLVDFEKNPVVQDFGNLLTVADMCWLCSRFRSLADALIGSRIRRIERQPRAWIDRFLEFESSCSAKAVARLLGRSIPRRFPLQ